MMAARRRTSAHLRGVCNPRFYHERNVPEDEDSKPLRQVAARHVDGNRLTTLHLNVKQRIS